MIEKQVRNEWLDWIRGKRVFFVEFFMVSTSRLRNEPSDTSSANDSELWKNALSNATLFYNVGSAICSLSITDHDMDRLAVLNNSQAFYRNYC